MFYLEEEEWRNTGNPNSPQLEDAEAVHNLPWSSFLSEASWFAAFFSLFLCCLLKNNLDSPWGMLKKRHMDLLINQYYHTHKKCCLARLFPFFRKKEKILLYPNGTNDHQHRESYSQSKIFWLFYNWHGTVVANRGLESLTFKGFLPFLSLFSWNIKLLPSDAKANQGTSRKKSNKGLLRT